MANGLAAGYSLVQGLRCVVSIVRGSVLFNKPLAWAIFSGDQVHLYAKSDRVFCLLQYGQKINIKMLASIAYVFITAFLVLMHFIDILIAFTFYITIAKS